MKVAIFTNNYKPIISGITESIESFREGLEKRGHKVFIFAPRFPGYKDSDPDVFRFASIDARYKTAFPIAISRSWKIYKKIQDLKIDIIHSQHPFNTGKAALRYARKLGIPIVFTNHTRYDIYTHFIPLLPQKFLKWYVKRASVNYGNKCDVVISPSESIKKMLINWGMTAKIEVIPTGVKLGQFAGAEGRSEIRKKFFIADDESLLLTVSRLAEEKNVDFLIRVFEKIKKSDFAGKKIKFMIIGDGSAKKDLEKMAENLGIKQDFIFTGAIPHKEIAPYYKAGDIFLYSSLSETQGIMTSEAMASGLPIVAVKAPGAQDIIEDGVDGILSPNNEETFAQKVKLLIEDEKLRKKIAEKAVLKAREYSLDVCAEKMVEAYLSLQKKHEVFYSPPFSKGGNNISIFL